MKYFILTIFFLFLFSCSDFEVKKINCNDDGDCPNTYTCNTQTHICYECNECGAGYSCSYRYGYKQTWCCNNDNNSKCYVPCKPEEIYSNVLNTCSTDCSDREEEDKENPLMCKCKKNYKGDDCSDCNTEAGYIAEGKECVPDCGEYGHLNDEKTECICDEEGYTGERCLDCDTEYISYNNQCFKKCDSDCQPNGFCIIEQNKNECVCKDGYTMGSNEYTGSVCIKQCSNASDCPAEDDFECNNNLCECKSGKQDVDGDGTCNAVCNYNECDSKGNCIYVNGMKTCDCDDGYIHKKNSEGVEDSLTCVLDCENIWINSHLHEEQCVCDSNFIDENKNRILEEDEKCVYDCENIWINSHLSQEQCVCNSNFIDEDKDEILENGEKCVYDCESFWTNSQQIEDREECTCDDGYTPSGDNSVLDSGEYCIPNCSEDDTECGGSERGECIIVNDRKDCICKSPYGKKDESLFCYLICTNIDDKGVYSDEANQICTCIENYIPSDGITLDIGESCVRDCNAELHFQPNQTNDDCECMNGYQLLNEQCFPMCPENELRNETTEECECPFVKENNICKRKYKELSIGSNHMCALLYDETVECMGNNDYGQIGNGVALDNNPRYSNSFEKVKNDNNTNLINVKQIVSGNEFSCAVVSTNNTVKCWGHNNYGQLGDGTQFDSSYAIPVNGLSDVKKISAGKDYVCALLNNKTIKCWGENLKGQFGNNTSMLENRIPVDSGNGIATVEDISTGNDFTCVLLTGGSVKCFGNDDRGQLGDSATHPIEDNKSTIPVNVYDLTDVKELYSGNDYSCAKLYNNSVKCWGNNQYGQFGIGGDQLTDLVAFDFPIISVNSADKLYLGKNNMCYKSTAIKCAGYYFGSNFVDNDLIDENNLGVVLNKVSFYDDRICYIDASTKIKCYGKMISTLPFQTNSIVDSLNNISINNYYNTYYVDTNNELFCEGENLYSQLGNYSSVFETIIPVNMNRPNTTAVSTGFYHNCILFNEGNIKKVACIGSNNYCQLGTNNSENSLYESNIFVNVRTEDEDNVGQYIDLTNVKQISSGDYHTCALIDDDDVSTSNINGEVMCWGYNDKLQLGLNIQTQPDENCEAAYVKEGGSKLTGVKSISAGGRFTCALMKTGQVQCWGDNLVGQLGRNNTVSTSNIPMEVKLGNSSVDLSSVLELSSGQNHACAVLSDTKAVCWGEQTSGRLGDNVSFGFRSYADYVRPATYSGAITGVSKISAGTYHTCLVLANGKVNCFGSGAQGELGDGTTQSRNGYSYPLPREVLNINTAKDVETGLFKTCVILKDDVATPENEENTYKCFGLISNTIPITYP